jgi:deoxyribodipyrimidine photo-lyase
MGFFYAMTTAIFWFRQDLRLSDNPAFLKACEAYDSVLPIYIDDNQHLDRTLGEASRAWLHHSLTSLKKSLQNLGSDLACYQGPAAEIIENICTNLDAEAVLWNRCYEPQAIARDSKIKSLLKARDVTAVSENASLFYEPWRILKKDQTPYRVFTPYWKMVYKEGLNQAPYSSPSTVPALPQDIPPPKAIEALELLPSQAWHESMLSFWNIG